MADTKQEQMKAQLLAIADQLGIVKDNALQEWATREAIESLVFMWQNWGLSLSEQELVDDVQQVITNLEKWRDQVLEQQLIRAKQGVCSKTE